MSGELIQFGFEGQEVRVHLDEAGNPWWVLVDLCRILDIINPSDVASRLDLSDRMGVGIPDPNGRIQITSVIKELALMRIIFRSRKPKAEQVKSWLFKDVLPSVRELVASKGAHMEMFSNRHGWRASQRKSNRYSW